MGNGWRGEEGEGEMEEAMCLVEQSADSGNHATPNPAKTLVSKSAAAGNINKSAAPN